MPRLWCDTRLADVSDTRALVAAVKLPNCEATVGPEAMRYNGKTHCTNLARYRIEGRNLCQRHAQQAALEIILRPADAPSAGEEK